MQQRIAKAFEAVAALEAAALLTITTLAMAAATAAAASKWRVEKGCEVPL